MTATWRGHEHASVWLSSDVGANQIKARYLALTDGLEPPDIQQFDRIFNLFDGTSETAVAVARDSWRRWSALEQVSCRYFLVMSSCLEPKEINTPATAKTGWSASENSPCHPA